jgi:hypothetical protein
LSLKASPVLLDEACPAGGLGVSESFVSNRDFQVPEHWIEEDEQAAGVPEAGKRARRAMKNINIERLRNVIAFEVRF